MHILKSHPSNAKSHYEIKASLEVKGSLILFFEVKSSYDFDKTTDFSKTPYKNWGLWEGDVVELFIRRIGETSYLEVQANPSGAGFQLMIKSPRKVFYTPLYNQIKVRCEIQKYLWKGSIDIPLDLIPGVGNKFEGGVFAILGSPREYYALNPNQDEVPDFHRPELFKKLI